MGGWKPFHDSCSSSPYAVANSNPNPYNFKILQSVVTRYASKVCLVVKIHYPDAKNFEGIKILVYCDIDGADNLLAKLSNKIDPHFNDSGPCPDARFPPTQKGWRNALAFAKLLVRLES